MQLLHIFALQLLQVALLIPEKMALLPSLQLLSFLVLTGISLQPLFPRCILLVQNRLTLIVEPIVPSNFFHVPDGAFCCVIDGCFDSTPAVLKRGFTKHFLFREGCIQVPRVVECNLG